MYSFTTLSPYLLVMSATSISLNLLFCEEVVFASNDFSFALNIINSRCSAGISDTTYSYAPLATCPVLSIRPRICTSSFTSSCCWATIITRFLWSAYLLEAWSDIPVAALLFKISASICPSLNSLASFFLSVSARFTFVTVPFSLYTNSVCLPVNSPTLYPAFVSSFLITSIGESDSPVLVFLIFSSSAWYASTASVPKSDRFIYPPPLSSLAFLLV